VLSSSFEHRLEDLKRSVTLQNKGLALSQSDIAKSFNELSSRVLNLEAQHSPDPSLAHRPLVISTFKTPNSSQLSSHVSSPKHSKTSENKTSFTPTKDQNPFPERPSKLQSNFTSPQLYPFGSKDTTIQLFERYATETSLSDEYKVLSCTLSYLWDIQRTQQNILAGKINNTSSVFVSPECKGEESEVWVPQDKEHVGWKFSLEENMPREEVKSKRSSLVQEPDQLQSLDIQSLQECTRSLEGVSNILIRRHNRLKLQARVEQAGAVTDKHHQEAGSSTGVGTLSEFDVAMFTYMEEKLDQTRDGQVVIEADFLRWMYEFISLSSSTTSISQWASSLPFHPSSTTAPLPPHLHRYSVGGQGQTAARLSSSSSSPEEWAGLASFPGGVRRMGASMDATARNSTEPVFQFGNCAPKSARTSNAFSYRDGKDLSRTRLVKEEEEKHGKEIRPPRGLRGLLAFALLTSWWSLFKVKKTEEHDYRYS